MSKENNENALVGLGLILLLAATVGLYYVVSSEDAKTWQKISLGIMVFIAWVFYLNSFLLKDKDPLGIRNRKGKGKK